jgi:two-component system sensor histidine kinase AlgZ
MHPLLTPISRYGIYLLAWMPLAGILIYLLAAPGKLGWLETTVLIVPLCLIYQFVCLSAWYTCKATPLQGSSFLRLRFTHVIAAVIISFLWVQVARLFVYALSETYSFRGLNERFAPQIPVLFGVGFLLYLLSVATHYVILAIEDSRRAEARAMETSILARDAELKALKAQVNPHFLFNSLNSISALTSSDPAKAREMCVLLGDFLRRTLGLGEKAAIPLEEELSLIRSFLAVEKVRFGARIQMEENIDKDALDVFVPPLLLQPLVENAVHGISNLVEGGSIKLEIHSRNGTLSIAIENSFDPDSPPRRRGGVGLANVRQRLATRHGSLASFDVKTEGDRYRVAITMPAERPERAS